MVVTGVPLFRRARLFSGLNDGFSYFDVLGCMLVNCMRIDPRDFIMTPYLRCPKCGAQEYGVLSVSDIRYERRCRACWHTATVYLPKIRKKIVYIDQFVFSNFVKMLDPELRAYERANCEPFWRQLFEILGVVCHIQLVACPDSREHQHESLTSSFYKSLKHTYEHFSGGVTLETAETVKLRQVGRIAECWLKKEPVTFDFDAETISSGRLHEWSGRIFITVDGLLPGTIDDLRTSRSKAHIELQQVFAQWQRDKKPFAEVFAAEKSAYRESLISNYIRQCQRRAQMAAQMMRGQMPSLDEILPSSAETQMSSLQYRFQAHAVDQKQANETVRDFLISDAMDAAPFSVIGAAMYASLSRKAASGQKRIPSQGTANDVEIVSTLLPYCDAMFVDNECRGLLRDIPKTHTLPYPCRVFSKNVGADFIRYLTEIRDSATPEHMKLVEEVYGPDSLKPPTSIYGVGKHRRSSEA